MTILHDTDQTAIREERLIAIQKTLLTPCPECAPEKDGEQKLALVLVFSGEDILIIDYDDEVIRESDYDMLCDQ